MNLFYVLLALISASASLVTASPVKILRATVDGGEIIAVNAELKPLTQSKRGASTARFRSLAKRRLSKRTDANTEASRRRRKKRPSKEASDPEFEEGEPAAPDSSGGLNGSKDDGSVDNLNAPSDNAEKLDEESPKDGGSRKVSKHSKKPKKKVPKKKKGGKKGGDDDGDDTGSDDDPDTDNASENENGTDNDDD